MIIITIILIFKTIINYIYAMIITILYILINIMISIIIIKFDINYYNYIIIMMDMFALSQRLRIALNLTHIQLKVLMVKHLRNFLALYLQMRT